MYSLLLGIIILLIGFIILSLGTFLKDDKIVKSNSKHKKIKDFHSFAEMKRFTYIVGGITYIIFGIGLVVNRIAFNYALPLSLILSITLKLTDYFICKKYINSN